ncbi:MAG: aminotransferase class I/II-fold pyridoxal phosphate-dependent enzyme [Caulobacterales bacterium]|nr:aminotransferase class I/II-fold pyridoxal phosphate-dependent enzyme [Caulobacterales bacterium]
MNTRLSRRSLLAGAAAGAGLVAGRAGPVYAEAPAVTFDPSPYFGPKPGYAQLARNENAYGPSAKALEAVQAAVARGGAYYDNGGGGRLAEMIAERHGLAPENIALTNGSGEILSAIAFAYGKTGSILTTDLFWDTTALYAERQGAAIVRVPNTATLGYDLEAMKAAVADDVALVHITNPNNPTGELLDGDALRAFCREVAPKATVLVDEAYNELAPDPDYSSMVDLVRAGENVIVARTFSKIYGLAGMRVGYAMAAPEVIETLRSTAMSWSNIAGLAAALATYEDQEFMAYSKGKIEEARQMISEAVTANGLTHLPTTTNFMLVDVQGDADDFRQKMLDRKVMIRGVYRTYTNWSRVSMGKIEDVERYVAALPEVIGA